MAKSRPEPVGIPQSDQERPENQWGWFLVLGFTLFVLGTIGLLRTFSSRENLLLTGNLLLMAGGAQILHLLIIRGWSGAFLQNGTALLYLLAGGIIILHPVTIAGAATTLLAGSLLAIGLLRIRLALKWSWTANWVLILVSGISTGLLGIMLAAGWPTSGFRPVRIAVTAELLFNGWTFYLLGQSLRPEDAGSQH